MQSKIFLDYKTLKLHVKATNSSTFNLKFNPSTATTAIVVQKQVSYKALRISHIFSGNFSLQQSMRLVTNRTPQPNTLVVWR